MNVLLWITIVIRVVFFFSKIDFDRLLGQLTMTRHYNHSSLSSPLYKFFTKHCQRWGASGLKNVLSLPGTLECKKWIGVQVKEHLVDFSGSSDELDILRIENEEASYRGFHFLLPTLVSYLRTVVPLCSLVFLSSADRIWSPSRALPPNWGSYLYDKLDV